MFTVSLLLYPMSIMNLDKCLYMYPNHLHVNILHADNINTPSIKVTLLFQIGKEITPGVGLCICEQVLL